MITMRASVYFIPGSRIIAFITVTTFRIEDIFTIFYFKYRFIKFTTTVRTFLIRFITFGIRKFYWFFLCPEEGAEHSVIFVCEKPILEIIGIFSFPVNRIIENHLLQLILFNICIKKDC